MGNRTLLLIDGVINLALGVSLLLFPAALVDALGIPQAESRFYPNILGAVLFGIGIALLVERFDEKKRMRGLGLAGAIAINLCGGIVLGALLLFGGLGLPLRGQVILWALVVVLVGMQGLAKFSPGEEVQPRRTARRSDE